MRAAEFRRTVKKKTRSIPGWAADAAVSFALDQGGPLDANAVARCLDLGRRFSASYEDTTVLPAMPGMLILSDELVDAITPEIERVRVKMFGKPTPPFQSIPEAAAWIEATAEAERFTPSPQQLEEVERLLEQADELVTTAARLRKQHLEHLTGGLLVNRFMYYAKPGSEAAVLVPVRPGSRLELLQATTERLAKETDFWEAAIVAYALVGLRPVLAPARVKPRWRWHRDIGTRRWVVIELYSGELGPKQLRQVYQRARRHLARHYAKPVSDEHRFLVETVKGLGGVPVGRARGGLVRFWKSVMAECNRHRRRPYTTWRGVEMRYRRLVKKIDVQRNGVGDDG
jgi:hypothetical protein